MTASDHLSPGQFFHGSDRRITTTVGDKSRVDTPNNSFFTNDPVHARDFGRYVYRVQPTGEYHEDYYEGMHPEGKTYISGHELKILGRHKA